MTMNKKGMVLTQHPQEKEMDLHPREAMVQTQRDLELSLRKRSISGVYHNIWQATEMINWEEYIPEKDVKEATVIKIPGPENLNPVKKLDDYLQELLKQKKRTQDIAIDKSLEKVQDKILHIIGPLWKLWAIVEQMNSGSGSSSIAEMDPVLETLRKTVF